MGQTGTKGAKEVHPLQDLMGMLTDQGGSKASWPVMLFVLAGIVIIFSVMGIRMAMAKRKAAELASKLRKAEEEKVQAAEAAKMIGNADDRKAAFEAIKVLNKDVLSLKAKMVKRSVDHHALLEDLKSVTSWDDLIIK